MVGEESWNRRLGSGKPWGVIQTRGAVSRSHADTCWLMCEGQLLFLSSCIRGKTQGPCLSHSVVKPTMEDKEHHNLLLGKPGLFKDDLYIHVLKIVNKSFNFYKKFRPWVYFIILLKIFHLYNIYSFSVDWNQMNSFSFWENHLICSFMFKFHSRFLVLV